MHRNLCAAEPTAPDVVPSGRRALLHGDPVPGNLILSPDGPVLIDWQCPATGDPTEDLAIFLSPAMQMFYRGRPLSADEAATFLGAYGDAATVARYRALAPWHHWRMAAYCLWRMARGGGDSRAEAAAFDAELAAMREAVSR